MAPLRASALGSDGPRWVRVRGVYFNTARPVGAQLLRPAGRAHFGNVVITEAPSDIAVAGSAIVDDAS